VNGLNYQINKSERSFLKMQKKLFVSIVICTHNRVQTLEKLAFKSIQRLNYSNYEIIIVDDNSTDGTEELVKKYQNKIPSLRYIKNNKNKGLCYVRNLGIKHSKGEIIAFIDDDCYVDKDWLKELVKPYLKDKKIMIVGGRSYIGDSKRLYNKKGTIIGCNMSFRKEIFNKFLFDTNIYFNRCSAPDESEILNRIRRRNFKILYNEKAIVKHFPMPAKYRKYFKKGYPLNLIYLNTKLIKILDYYKAIFFYYLPYHSLNKFILKRKSVMNKYYMAICDMLIRSKLNNKIIPLYQLLLEIPIKAKIKNWLEERKIENNILK